MLVRFCLQARTSAACRRNGSKMSIFRFSSAYCSLSEFKMREPALLSDHECSTKTGLD